MTRLEACSMTHGQAGGERQEVAEDEGEGEEVEEGW
jgi:hypothetical protein